MRTNRRLSKAKWEHLPKVTTYLVKSRSYMQHDVRLSRGYPIGSGLVGGAGDTWSRAGWKGRIYDVASPERRRYFISASFILMEIGMPFSCIGLGPPRSKCIHTIVTWVV